MTSRSLPGLLATALAALLGAACGGPTVEIVDDSLQVVHASPHHGAIDVELSPSLLVGFTEALDASKLDAAVTLLGEDDDGELSPLGIRALLEDEGFVLLVVPRAALAAGRRHRLEINTQLEGRAGARLLTPFRTEFITRR